MTIIGYGEDGLTYWGLTTQLQTILDRLGDPTGLNDCTIFFRPSFGRRGGNTSPQFGEFDSILVTRKAVYPIESKWDNASNRAVETVALEEVQTTRHAIFAWLRLRWQEQTQPRNWPSFYLAVRDDYTRTFPNRPLPTAKRLLARNLAHILREVEELPAKTQDVVLYFHREKSKPPLGVVNSQAQPLMEFKLVCLVYEALGESGYFRMLS